MSQHVLNAWAECYTQADGPKVHKVQHTTHFHNTSYCSRLKINCNLQEIIIDYMQHYEEERCSAFDIEEFAYNIIIYSPAAHGGQSLPMGWTY